MESVIRKNDHPGLIFQNDKYQFNPEEWLLGMNANQIYELPDDWNKTSAFLYSKMKSLNPYLLLTNPNPNIKPSKDALQMLERLCYVLSKTFSECVADGIKKFAVLLTPLNSYGIAALDLLLEMKQENAQIQVAVLVDLYQVDLNLFRYNSYDNKFLDINLTRFEKLIQQCDFVIWQKNNELMNYGAIAPAFVSFCTKVCRAAICYVSDGMLERLRLVRECQAYDVKIISIYNQCLAPYDEQYEKMKNNKMYFQSLLRNAAQEIIQSPDNADFVKDRARKIEQFQRKIIQIDHWMRKNESISQKSLKDEKKTISSGDW